MTGVEFKAIGNAPSGTPFGLQEGSRLVDHFHGFDLRPGLNHAVKAQMKALTTQAGGAGTAGYAMIPVSIDPRIVDYTRKYTPLVELIPRVANQGMYAEWNKITAKGAATFGAEDGAEDEQTDTEDRCSKQIKFLRAVGRVTGPAKAAMPPYVLQGFESSGTGLVGSSFGSVSAPNGKEYEILKRARSLRELEEDAILNGDASSDALEFDGIMVQQGTTNKVTLTAAVALANLDTAVGYAFADGGRPNLGICSAGAYATILALLTAKIGYLQSTAQVFWGFSTIVYNSMVGAIPLIPSQFLAENTHGTVVLLDMDYVEMRVLQDMTYEDLAKTNDSDKFHLKIYECLILKNPNFNAILKIA